MEPQSFGDLTSLGIPESLVKAWASRMKRSLADPLLDLQRQAFGNVDSLKKQHTIVLGPTSSGKTFVGEALSALVALPGEGTVVYAVPYRALATQKWEDWRKSYSDSGMPSFPIYASSSDHVAHDSLVAQGDFRIAIIVYEKLAALIAQGAKLLDRCKLLIVDEFQMLAQSDRGPRLEFILTKILKLNELKPEDPVMILGLSAALTQNGNEILEKWLERDLACRGDLLRIQSTVRPVPLIEQVLLPDGSRIYKDERGQKIEDKLTLPPAPPHLKHPDNLVASLVGLLSKEDKKVMVFRGSRKQSSQTAQSITAVRSRIQLSPELVDTLDNMEPTPFMDHFRNHLVERGVAFHNASLSFEERQLVEESFHDQDGPVSVLCSTETLAVGINLPADTVVVADLRKPAGAEKGTTPLSLSDYKNMVGRAGRFGYTDKVTGKQIVGQSFLLADNYVEADRHFRRYIEPDDPGQELSSAIGFPDLQHQILSILSSKDDAAVFGLESKDAEEFLSASLYALKSPNLAGEVASAWSELVEKGLIVQSMMTGFSASGLGELLAQSGLSVKCADTLKLIEKELAAWADRRFPLDLLFLACLTPEVMRQQWPGLDESERSWRPVETLKKLGETVPLRSSSLLSMATEADRLPPEKLLLAVKRAYLIFGWSEGRSIKLICKEFGDVQGGDIKALADVVAWVLDVVVHLARESRILSKLAPWLGAFRASVEHGVPVSVLALARLKVRGLKRPYLIELAKFIDASLGSFESIEDALGARGCPLPADIRNSALLAMSEERDRAIGAQKASHLRRAGEMATPSGFSELVSMLYAATEIEFEKAVVGILARLELSAKHVGKGIALPDLEISIGNELVIGEMKSGGRKIGYDQVRQIQSAVTEGRSVTNRFVVSKSGFTDGAVAMNEKLPGPALLLRVDAFAELCVCAAEQYGEKAQNAVEWVLMNRSGLLSPYDVRRLVRKVGPELISRPDEGLRD
jgi:replicative superfamily II helicase